MCDPGIEHWLDLYGSHRYDWQQVVHEGQTSFARRLGIVESFFDHDGTHFGGRADVTCLLTLEAQSRLEASALRSRILLAWAVLRSRHALMRARAVEAESQRMLDASTVSGRCFVVDEPSNARKLVSEAEKTISFVAEHVKSGDIDPKDFFRHSMNTGRCFDATQNLAHLFVLPLQQGEHGNQRLHTVMVFAHEISDGLSANATNAEFIDLLNEPEDVLHDVVKFGCSTTYLKSILPPAQEAMYPPLARNRARERWQWAISRALRHKRKPPLDAFKNPLKREEPLAEPQQMPPKFAGVLDYTSAMPPINTYVGFVTLQSDTTSKTVRLCREAKVSVGSGLFALVGLAQMTLYERSHPLRPGEEHPAFVASFPLNIRPFLNYDKSPDSIVLGFSDGLSLPFLPSHLPAEGRFKLLARQAHRQLKVYQKGVRSAKDEALLGSRSPAQVIPSLYLSTFERYLSRLPSNDLDHLYPQGSLAVPTSSGATNGVSSVGNRSAIIKAGKHKLDGSKDFAADFRDLACAPRAREGEFLCAVQGDGAVVHVHVAYDANSIDEARFEAFKDAMESLLKPKADAKL